MGKMRNDVIPNAHFHKDWQNRVKTWFNQPARKLRRRTARASKAAASFPRPTQGPLRPSVPGTTIRYNFKQKLGRGFTVTELKEAGINRHQALSLGVAVDVRRKNRTEETLKRNVHRLKAYKSKLVVFPRDNKKPKAGEASADQRKSVQQTTTSTPAHDQSNKGTYVKSGDVNAKAKPSAFTTVKVARTDARLIGIRKVRAQKKAEKAALDAAKENK